jgi:membrane carboxypeptidase/penicillin-binding protein PbpC
LLSDTPDAIRDEYSDDDPQNYNHHYLGPVRLREALGCSLNVPAVFTLSQIGARPAFYQLQKWCFDFPRVSRITAPVLCREMLKRDLSISLPPMQDWLAVGVRCVRNF